MRNSKHEELLSQLIWFFLPSFSRRICYFWHQEGTFFRELIQCLIYKKVSIESNFAIFFIQNGPLCKDREQQQHHNQQQQDCSRPDPPSTSSTTIGSSTSSGTSSLNQKRIIEANFFVNGKSLTVMTCVINSSTSSTIFNILFYPWEFYFRQF